MERRIALSRICKSKIKYETKIEAKQRAYHIKHQLYAYHCNCCKKWHLTSKTKEEQKGIGKLIHKIQKKNDENYRMQIEDEANYWILKKGWNNLKQTK